MIEQHSKYDPATGTFEYKLDALVVAERIRSMMERRFNGFHPAAVKAAGKRNKYWIEFPALQRFWHPAATDPHTIAAHLAEIANDFITIYERKDQ